MFMKNTFSIDIMLNVLRIEDKINDHCKDSSNYCFMLCGSNFQRKKHKKSGDGKNHYFVLQLTNVYSGICGYVSVSHC